MHVLRTRSALVADVENYKPLYYLTEPVTSPTMEWFAGTSNNLHGTLPLELFQLTTLTNDLCAAAFLPSFRPAISCMRVPCIRDAVLCMQDFVIQC